MSDFFPPFDESQLSPEKREILRRFEKLEDAPPAPPNLTLDKNLEVKSVPSVPSVPSPNSPISPATNQPSARSVVPTSDADFLEDMLPVFAFEADEDIAVLRRTLRQIEQEDALDMARLTTLQRVAHKIKGTSGAIGCVSMSGVAYLIEAITRLVIDGAVNPIIGLHALVQAVVALEVTLDGLIADRQEHSEALDELRAELESLGIEVAASGANAPALLSMPDNLAPSSPPESSPSALDTDAGHGSARTAEDPGFVSPFVRVDTRRFEQLLRHTEQMAELQAPLEQAQTQVETALKELQAAQARLRDLETVFSSLAMSSQNTNIWLGAVNDELPSSSLVARILNESLARTGHFSRGKARSLPVKSESGPPLWDELEIEHYTEGEVLVQQFSEAIADVATASSQLRLAFAHLNDILQRHKLEAANVRSGALLLRLTPLSALLSRLRRAVLMSAFAQAREVRFEVTGETIEIDQDVLEELKNPLLQLVRSCILGSVTTEDDEMAEGSNELYEQHMSHISHQPSEDHKDHSDRVWLHVQAIGHEVAIEVGFSMPVVGGALDAIYESILRLNGRIFAQRNKTGGVSFHLRLPRSEGAVQGLLVRVAGQQIMIPFSQVQRIDYRRQEAEEREQRDDADLYYTLNDLLRFPSAPLTSGSLGTGTAHPVLVLQADQPRVLVEVEAILGSVELVVKPLPTYLRRSGITGTAIDGMGNVLLLLNLSDLVQHHRRRMATPFSDEEKQISSTAPPRRSILVADDSVFIRQSLLHGLRLAGYAVAEARDGMDALEKLLEQHPDILVLDIEMPNLNGYDLLSILHAYPELARVKIIMLTSRSSEKHRVRALELGAHAYLTKPCPQDTLLETIEDVLQGSVKS